MRDVFFALGVVLAVEGLFLAIAPARVERVMEFLRQMGPERLRYAGLASACLGTLILLIVH